MKALALVCLMLVLVFSAGCASRNDFNHQVNVAVKPYRFSIAGWEFETIFARVGQVFAKGIKVQDETKIIDEYLSLGNRISALKTRMNDANRSEIQSEVDDLQVQRNEMTNSVEKIVKRQTGEVLSELGIYQPWYKNIKLKISFPAPEFELEEAPHLLVISPRDKIETIKDVLLVENLNLEDMQSIEAKVAELDVSSLVVDLGGLGTYPNLVASDSGFNFIIETCAHEWAHAYLAFTPLGSRYVLNIAGITNTPEIDTINETVASIVGKEIGAAVLKKYYPQLQNNNQAPENKPVFDFDKEMKTIRKQVDLYLAAGKIEDAEKYMSEKRDYLAVNGYYIRKLNQAYFAFNGKYADTPAFENPIGTALNQLRENSASLHEFLDIVSRLTNLKGIQSVLSGLSSNS